MAKKRRNETATQEERTAAHEARVVRDALDPPTPVEVPPAPGAAPVPVFLDMATEFEQTDISLEELAKKHGLSLERITLTARRDEWQLKRRMFRDEQSKRMRELALDERAEVFRRRLQIRRAIMGKALAALKKHEIVSGVAAAKILLDCLDDERKDMGDPTVVHGGLPAGPLDPDAAQASGVDQAALRSRLMALLSKDVVKESVEAAKILDDAALDVRAAEAKDANADGEEGKAEEQLVRDLR